MDRDEERNYYGLLLLLLRVGTPKLRDFFIRKWNSASGHRPWNDSPQNGADLMLSWKPTILPYEKPKVLSGNTLKWDLSLFVKILSPNEHRRAMRKALDKLKDLRNSLCHTYEARLTNHDFQGKWNDVCNALTLFGAKSEDFKSVKNDAKQPLKDLRPVVMKWLAHEFEILHNGQLQHLQKLEKVEEGQLTLCHKIQQCQNVILCELKEIQHVTAGGTNEPELKQPDVVANQSMACEGKTLPKYLKEYYRTGVRAILLPFPWIEGEQFYIENIYTKTEIVERNTNNVTSLEEISSKAATDPKNPRLILIEGEPGIGKSAVCKKIAYDWSTNKLFKNFEVVLSLKCRDFHTANDLWDAIEMQTFSDGLKEKKTDIFKYIKSNQSKVLLVLDGYDEIPDTSAASMKQSIDRLICGKLLPDCSVIMTSRPGKGSVEIRNHFDKKLEIKGFKLNDAFTFVGRFFVSSPEKASSSISFIERCEDAKDLVRSPLNTAILCLQKENNEELSIGNLSKEMISSIIKRYFVEKLGQEVPNDDEIASVVQSGRLDWLGKAAFILTISDRENEVDEKVLHGIVNPTGLIALLFWISCGIASNFWIRKIFHKESIGDKVNDNDLVREFLVYKKPLATINTDNSFYTFPHAPLKEHLAADYVKEAFSNFYLERIFILAFKDWLTFVRVISFIGFVLKRCLKDQGKDIIGYLLFYLVVIIRFGGVILIDVYSKWNSAWFDCMRTQDQLTPPFTSSY